MKKTLKLLVISAAALSACVSFAADTVKIGVLGPYTSGSSSMGIALRNGARLAAEEINKAGGVLGKKIELVERDDEAKGDTSTRVARAMIAEDGVAGVVGYANTGVSIASQHWFQKAKIPVINNVATGTAITNQFKDEKDNYIFRTSAADSIQAPMIVEDIIKSGKKKVALMVDITPYGQFGRADVEKAMEAKGMKPLLVERFAVGTKDMTEALNRVKAAGADVIVTYAIGPELAQISLDMKKMGMNLPVVGSWTLSMASYTDLAGDAGNGVRMPQTFIQEANTPKRKEFIANYIKSFSPKNDRIESPVAAAQGYDSVKLMVAAIKQAGVTDGPKVREALENLGTKVEGLVTTYDKPFSATDHEAITANIPVMGELKDGRIIYAYEADKKNATTIRMKQK